MTPLWALLAQVFAVPALLGVAGTLWAGAPRLAAHRPAGRDQRRLGIFLYGTIAVAALGAGDTQGDGGWTVSDIVSDRLGNNVIFYLWFLPLTTAAFAWAAAAATARVRRRPNLAAAAPFGAVAAPRPMSGGLAVEGSVSAAPPRPAERAIPVSGWRRSARLALIGAAVAAVLILIAAGWLVSGR